jgi:hypothetical protein
MDLTPSEPKKLPSVAEILDQFKADTEQAAPQQPKWENIHGTGDSVLDKFSNIAEWKDILVPAGWTEAKVQDSDTAEAWKRPGGTSPISAKVPKVAPETIVVWSTDAGLPSGPDQKLNKAKVYAHLHYGGDLSAASKALVRGEAVGLPTVVVAACKTEPRDPFEGIYTPKDPPPDDYPPEDPYQGQPEPDPATIFAEDVEKAARRIRVREAARELVDAHKRPPAEPFDAGTLAEILARPDDPPARIDELMPWESSTLTVAQRKVGKTTFQLNACRSLITGQDFLGKFGVRPIGGEIAYLNFEVSGAQLARWAADVGIPADRFYIVNLRGRRNPFSNTEDRQRLAATLKTRGTEAIFCDPFGRAYTGQNQNDPGEVGAWLISLDQFARAEVGALDLVLATHAGWNGERTRGSSALEDWADSIITMTRDDSDDGNGARYLRAIGRDVDLEEDQLAYDASTRILALTGLGSRKAAARQRRAEKNAETLREEILKLVARKPRLNGSEVERELREAGVSFQRGEHRSILKALVDDKKLTVEPGKRNAKCYQITQLAQLAQASPELAHGLGGEVGVELAQPAYIEAGLTNTNTDTNTGPTETPPETGLGRRDTGERWPPLDPAEPSEEPDFADILDHLGGGEIIEETKP